MKSSMEQSQQEGTSKNDEIHFAKDTKVLLQNEPYRFREDIIGKWGRVDGKGFVANKMIEFRFAATPKYKEMLRTESRTIVTLLKYGSTRAFRILVQGEINTLRYIITTPMGKCLQDVMKLYPHMQSFAQVHIILQTFLCLRDLHAAKIAHFSVNPSSFSLKKTEPRVIVFSYFQTCVTFKDLRDEPRKYKPETMNRYTPRSTYSGQRVGQPDDFEAWLYMVMEILNGSASWTKTRNFVEVILKKYMVPVEYCHKNEDVERRMKAIIDLVFTCSVENAMLVDELIYRELIDWHFVENAETNMLPWEKSCK